MVRDRLLLDLITSTLSQSNVSTVSVPSPPTSNDDTVAHLEAFAGRGRATVSGLIFPDPGASLLRVYSVGDAGAVRWALYALPK